MRAIHEQMNGKTAEDAQQLLDELIEMLSSEHNDLNDVPSRQTLVIQDDVPQSSVPPTNPSSLISMSVTTALIPLSATPMPGVERSAVNIIADALGPTGSTEKPLIVTQTVYVTATPSNIASASAKASSTTDEDNAKSMAELMNKYNNGTHDYSRTIIILLCIFGSILVIGMLIAGLWWRKDRKRRQQRAFDREKEMEEQSRRPPGGYAYEQFMASKQGLNTRQPQDYLNEAGSHTSPTAPPNNSSQFSGAPSQSGNEKKYKGKATNLPAINTGSAQVEDPPISPTFVPLPGTPMKLVSRQQVFQDPQRRRGVDALDTDAQQESNQKHWKSVHSDDGISSVTNTKPMGHAPSSNKGNGAATASHNQYINI